MMIILELSLADARRACSADLSALMALETP